MTGVHNRQALKAGERRPNHPQVNLLKHAARWSDSLIRAWVMHILDAYERYDSICCPSRVPSSLFLATGRTSGATHSIASSVARERRPRTNRTVEVVVSDYLRTGGVF